MDDLLDLKQMQDGFFSLVNEVFDPNEVIELVCSIFEPQTTAQKVKLLFMLCERLEMPSSDQSQAKSTTMLNATTNMIGTSDKIPKVYADGRRFQQVMINLVKNAIKFTNKG